MRLSRFLLKNMVIFFDKMHFYWPIALCYAVVVKKVQPSTGKTNRGAPRLLALSIGRFRHDLELLANSLEVEVLIVPEYWQNQLISLYRRSNSQNLDHQKGHIDALIDYFNPKPGSKVACEQQQVRRFLKAILKQLYSIKDIKGVLSAAIHYKRDLDWGAVSSQLGVKYIVLHKENLYLNQASQHSLIELWNQLGPFQGDQVIVHSHLMRSLFLQSSLIKSEKISVCGCLRQDILIKRLREKGLVPQSLRKKVVLFSFNHGSGFLPLPSGFTSDPEKGFTQLFDAVHIAVAQCALKHPDVDFLIKPKWKENWVEAIEKSIEKSEILANEIVNLNIEPTADPLQALLTADIVIGFNSTTLFEAAVCGKTVIMPLFAEATGQFSNYVNRPAELDIFDIADSQEDLIQLIEKKLFNTHPISSDMMKKRYKAFEEYVSSFENMAIDLYIKQIHQTLALG